MNKEISFHLNLNFESSSALNVVFHLIYDIFKVSMKDINVKDMTFSSLIVYKTVG